MLDDGVWAEIKVGDEEHPRLFSEHSAQGVQAAVYNEGLIPSIVAQFLQISGLIGVGLLTL